MGKYVMSVTHLRLGVAAVKLRSSQFSGGCFVGSAWVVVGPNDLEILLFSPIFRIATVHVLRQADSRSSRFKSSEYRSGLSADADVALEDSRLTWSTRDSFQRHSFASARNPPVMDHRKLCQLTTGDHYCPVCHFLLLSYFPQTYLICLTPQRTNRYDRHNSRPIGGFCPSRITHTADISVTTDAFVNI